MHSIDCVAGMPRPRHMVSSNCLQRSLPAARSTLVTTPHDSPARCMLSRSPRASMLTLSRQQLRACRKHTIYLAHVRHTCLIYAAAVRSGHACPAPFLPEPPTTPPPPPAPAHTHKAKSVRLQRPDQINVHGTRARLVGRGP